MPSEIQFAKCPLVHWIISDEEIQSFDSLEAFVVAVAQLMVELQVVFGILAADLMVQVSLL